MLYYDRIDVFEAIYINPTNKSKQCNIVQYWQFFKKGFQFQPYVSNRRHYFLMMPINLSDICILKNKGAYYCCIICGIGKSEAINLMQNIDLTEKSRTL